MTNKILWAAAACLLGLGAACGGASMGEQCETSGATSDECEDGLVCAKASDVAEVLTCQKLCTADADCQATEQCNGVTGTSLKSCRPK